VWGKLTEMFPEERRQGIYDVDVSTPSTITSHAPGYIDKDQEIIVGLQTDAPLKRAIMPNGGWRMVVDSLKAYGREPDPRVAEIFTKYRKTHNDGVFDAYTTRIRKARSSHIITGLPDAYGRGRIIGDYRRVALYGVDRLIEAKHAERALLDEVPSSEPIIRDREELAEQARALGELKQMAASYGYDIGVPARTGREALQWLYFGYLAAVKEQNGAAMSLGRTSTFLDTYFARDLAEGTLTEEQAQEMIDDFVIKLRIVRFLRTPAYDELFSGDPTWVTESIGGMSDDGRALVTKTSFRYLQTLYNLGPAPEPNLTIFWSTRLPEGFKRFCVQASADTSAIQYENDDLMRPMWGDDTAIACCVSAMRVGKQLQFFGARANLAKTLLYAINGGRDEISGNEVAEGFEPITGDHLDFDEVSAKFDQMMDWLARTYVEALNVIHYAKVKVVRDESGLAGDYAIEGDFPQFGNNDDRVDSIAVGLIETFMEKIRSNPSYRDATHTQSVLTITSNVVYGKNTGSTPDGRPAGAPFAPGANPMHGRDTHGLIASALSVAKLPYTASQDGISLTSSVTPGSLGRSRDEQISNLTGVLDGYFDSDGFHMNLNVLDRETLLDAMEHPDQYPQLTIRVSGYAVNFTRLTREQQNDVITRTFHESL
jgi:formate C-acetyltransferase